MTYLVMISGAPCDYKRIALAKNCSDKTLAGIRFSFFSMSEYVGIFQYIYWHFLVGSPQGVPINFFQMDLSKF